MFSDPGRRTNRIGTVQMKKDEFVRCIEEDKSLQSRFLEAPEKVLSEFAVETELSEAELGAVAGGASSESMFVHRLLTRIVENQE